VEGTAGNRVGVNSHSSMREGLGGVVGGMAGVTRDAGAVGRPEARADRPERRLRHDLRQSLSTVMMLASVVDHQPLDGPMIRDSLDQMLHEVGWMKKVISGHPADQGPVLVDVGEAVAAVWDSIALAQECQLRLVRESGLCAWSDPVGLGRAVRNLIENAVRAASDGSDPPVVEVRVVTGRDTVDIEVGDSGPGFGRIPPQERLGLITVRRFASEQNGRLLVEKSHLGGALMRLVLPSANDDGGPMSDELVEQWTTA
jgi:K+-sensing histidine kinase KdpD